MNINRKKTKQVSVGNVKIGGDAPISIQSMLSCPTTDIKAVTDEIRKLEDVGCEIIRLAIPNEEAARCLKKIRTITRTPLIADIHFQHSLALMALEAGIDGLRINPGNIGGRDKVKIVAREAKARGVPIRIGVNSGSLEESLLDKYGWPKPEALVESALNHAKLLEDEDFHDIKISIKSSSVTDTIDAYRLLSSKVDYPLHLGVTEAGSLIPGTVKSSVGMGVLLSEGIGDTIRVSLTADTTQEVRVGYELLASLNLRKRPWPEVVSCPTCGRVQIDLQSLVAQVEERVKNIRAPLKITVLGCVVNGPGEAREADIGIAGGKGKGFVIKKGEIIKTCKEEDLLDELMKEIDKMV
ncbi:MAG: flavodoxin-dependent (E)-4-hydroxy-3-methylbut-2-enyl-diphosphate synthase [Syntrophaceae bacterium]|nr:flavodoxin-dependent (E)-4-hydroxy-3-methylbut-2-enyl-diphosphate synthase [bacterium]MCG2739908.1 flavodoxin-dependent (E)-4-hydroxy-3-methylbut-2-enyl-diphosphate synthase [Syntrophaceae bacterium]